MPAESEPNLLSRREVLRMIGVGAAAVALPASSPALPAPSSPLSASSSAAAITFPKGAVIRTVLEDHAPDDLAGGATLFHEHLSFAPDFMTRWVRYAAETRAANGLPPAGGGGRGAQSPQGQRAAQEGQRGAQAPPAQTAPFFMQDDALMAEELRTAKTEGISCIVDGGHPDMGRDFNALRQLSMRSGMPIVAGGGFYTQPFYPAEIKTMSEEQIVQALVEQCETDPIGVFGEIGSWDDMTTDERKVFRAIGKAHLQTNLPIFTHTGIPGKAALEQLDILEDAGVSPNRIVIGHLGNLVDPNVQVQKAICRRGAFVGFDRQGGQGDAQQVPMVMALLEAGFAEHLMFSADFSNPAQLKHNGGDGYAKTLTVFVPKLKAAGANDEVLRGIMVDNPRRFLAFVPKKARKA